MKYLSHIKSRIIKTAIKSAIIIAACGLILAGSYFVFGDSTEQLEQLNNKDRSMMGEISSSKDRFIRAQNTLESYNKLIGESKQGDSDLNRKNIAELLDRLKSKHEIRELIVDITPIVEKTEGVFAKKTGTIITTTITLKFSHLSDAKIFAFVEDVIASFDGYLNIQSFDITRPEQIQESMIETIMKKGNVELFKAELVFDWLGLRINKKEQEASNNPNSIDQGVSDAN